jgi:O-antigen/teichoic acid export membrane protein/glycosyltransferase involved in cell wall biosynthesis
MASEDSPLQAQEKHSGGSLRYASASVADRVTAWIASLTGSQGEDYVAPLANLLRSSGTYALAALIAPLISLVLTPFIAHHLSPTEYGVLTLLNAGIALMAAVTHLGQGDALLRAFNYDYTSPEDQRQVMATAIAMLAGVTVPIALLVALLAPSISRFLFGDSTRGSLVILAATIVLTYGLTVPAFAWLRSSNRAFLYSVLLLCESATILVGTIALVGIFHLGVAGALIANVAGYAGVVLFTLPVMLFRSGFRVRTDVAWSLLTFGLPLVSGSVSTWVLQLSDRYLLSMLRSLPETATYAVGYTLGSALTVIVVRPFLLAWPTTMYSIAQRENSAQLFRVTFRWFAVALLFAAFGLVLTGRIVLDWLFPPAYRPAAPIIPLVAAGLVFYGAYSIFATGATLERKTWLLAIYTAVSAAVNIGCNLLLIPPLGSVGSAIATLVAYATLAGMAYVGNQAVHPVRFQLGWFLVAFAATGSAYAGGEVLSSIVGEPWAWPIRILAWLGCGVVLVLMGRVGSTGLERRAVPPRGSSALSSSEGVPGRVCMLLLGTARADARVMREAAALSGAGSDVTVVDIEHDARRTVEEHLSGVRLKHVMMSGRHIAHYEPTHHMRWLLFKALRMLLTVQAVVRTPADVYHAHDITALPPCYVAAKLRRKPLVYDAHELPLVDPHITRRRLLSGASTAVLKLMMARCTAVITVSPPLVSELQRRYGGTSAVVVRNVPSYQSPVASDRLRERLGLKPAVRIVLYQGGLQANRGLDAAVRAVRFMAPGSVLVLLGAGEAAAQLQRTAKEEQVEDRVMFLAPVPYDELHSWTASADVGLLVNTPQFSPNTRMGLPNKLFEYLMAGLPVFVSQLDSVADLVRTYDVGVVARSLDPEAIGRSLDAMLLNGERLDAMRRNALAACRQHLRWDVESERLVHLYRTLA